MIKKRNVPVPDWIKELPAGTYTSEDLINITGMTIQGFTRALIKYGAEITREPCYHNLYKNIYIWKGYKEEEKSK